MDTAEWRSCYGLRRPTFKDLAYFAVFLRFTFCTFAVDKRNNPNGSLRISPGARLASAARHAADRIQLRVLRRHLRWPDDGGRVGRTSLRQRRQGHAPGRSCRAAVVVG